MNIGLIFKLAALLKKMHPAKYILWYETPQQASWKPIISFKNVQFYLYAKNYFMLQNELLN